MGSELISIVIPCYNVEEFISEAIDSALAQEYKNVEVICVDNGSSDDTVGILENYAEAGKIKLLHQPIKGAPAARNKGWKAGSGEWIQFLDADDLILPKKISHQMDLIAGNRDLPFIASATTKRDLSSGKEVEWELLGNSWHGLLQNRLGITTANLFNRDYLEKVGGWDESMKSSQEYDLMFRMMQESDAIVHDDNPSLSIIQSRSEGSISATDVDGNKHRFLHLVSGICQYMKAERKEDYGRLGDAYFQEMFVRIRLNTIDGFPDSPYFYWSILPDSFKADKHPYTPAWFRWVMGIFGFAFADGIQRLKG